MAGLTLSGCQSTAIDDALAISGNGTPTAESGTIPETEVIGAGPVRIAMLLPRSGERQRNNAADFRDGAALAMNDLNDGSVTLTIYDTKGVLTEVTRLARKATESGSQVIIGPTGPSAVSSLVKLKMGEPPLIIALTPDIPLNNGNVFTMMSEEIDSAGSIVGYALAAGKSRFAVLVPENLAASSRTRLKKALAAQHAKVLGIIDYSADMAGSARKITGQSTLFNKADAVIVVAGPGLAAVVSTLRAEKVITADRVLLSTSAWPRDILLSKDANGVLVALPSQTGLRQITGSFTAKYGRPPSADAAYAYDATAIVLGIARVLGPDALNAETLTSSTGFRGATGVFRFNKDGSIDRRLPVYTNANGNLKLVRAAPKSF